MHEPFQCPICGDPLIEPMERVCLSATINGVISEVHGVSAYRCTNWHIFTVIAPRVSLGFPETLAGSGAAGEGV